MEEDAKLMSTFPNTDIHTHKCPVQQDPVIRGCVVDLKPGRDGGKGKRSRDQGGFLSRSQFIRLKCQVISTHRGEIGRG